MAKLLKITGVERLIRRMDRATKRYASGTARGLKRGGLLIQRESQKIVPIDLDILRPSARTRNFGGQGFDTDIVVSFRTDYAVFVHENLDAAHAGETQAKFLEKPARENLGKVLKIIREEAKVR